MKDLRTTISLWSTMPGALRGRRVLLVIRNQPSTPSLGYFIICIFNEFDRKMLAAVAEAEEWPVRRKNGDEALSEKSCKSLRALRWSQLQSSLSWEHARLSFSNAGENKPGLLHTASNSFFQGWALALIRWVFEGPDHRDCLGVCAPKSRTIQKLFQLFSF